MLLPFLSLPQECLSNINLQMIAFNYRQYNVQIHDAFTLRYIISRYVCFSARIDVYCTLRCQLSHDSFPSPCPLLSPVPDSHCHTRHWYRKHPINPKFARNRPTSSVVVLSRTWIEEAHAEDRLSSISFPSNRWQGGPTAMNVGGKKAMVTTEIVRMAPLSILAAFPIPVIT